MNYHDVLTRLGNRTSRKVANNTHLILRRVDTCRHFPIGSSMDLTGELCAECDGLQGAIGLRLHNTFIITWYPNGLITLDAGQWQTNTTKSRFNAWLPTNYRVWATKRVWWLYKFGANSGTIEHKAEFENGMTIKTEVK